LKLGICTFKKFPTPYANTRYCVQNAPPLHLASFMIIKACLEKGKVFVISNSYVTSCQDNKMEMKLKIFKCVVHFVLDIVTSKDK